MDTIDTTPQRQIGGSKNGEEEDLYFVQSDEDEEEEGEEKEEENKEKKRKHTKPTTITEATEQMGKRGEANDDEDLYFVPSNKEEENGGEARENERNNILIHEKKQEDITAESELTRIKTSKESNHIEKGTRETKKKMKVTGDNLPFGHACDDIYKLLFKSCRFAPQCLRKTRSQQSTRLLFYVILLFTSVHLQICPQ
jgi:hypothetical protein